MGDRLTFAESEKTWYPASMESLREHLSVVIQVNTYFDSKQILALKSNIAYNLQYLEFLDQLFKDIKLSTVLKTQNIKSFVVYGSSVIEAIFYYIIISKGQGVKTELKSYKKIKSHEYEIEGHKFCHETELFIKISPPIDIQMTFDQMCKKVENKKLLGNDLEDLYKKISRVRKLRNKVHIQGIENSQDTDYWKFNQKEFNLMKEILYGILTSTLFSSSSLNSLFDYLK